MTQVLTTHPFVASDHEDWPALAVCTCRSHAQLPEQRLRRKILRPSLGADYWETQLVEPRGKGGARRLEAQPLTPELTVAATPETNCRTRAVVLMLQADIAYDFSRLVENHSPETQLIISIKEVDLGLNPFARVSDSRWQF
jgi:hypothetical protein